MVRFAAVHRRARQQRRCSDPALESMARAITGEENPHIRDVLDIASGAVLTAAFGAIAVGLVLFGHRSGQVLGWW